MIKKTNKLKRFFAGILSVILVTLLFLPHIRLQPVEGNDMTGLKLYWTSFPYEGNYGGWPRKTYFLGGTGEYKGMNQMYCYCVANHSGQADMGSEAWIERTLTLQDYMKLSANKDSKESYPEKNQMMKFALCLAAAATVAPGQQTLSDLQDKISTSYLDIMAQSVFLALEGRMGGGSVILTMDRETARAAYYEAMEREYTLTASGGRQLNATITNQLLSNRGKFFDDIWDAALIMYNAITESNGSLSANTMSYTVDENDPSQLIVTVPCYGSSSVWNKYYSSIKITSSGWQLVKSSFDGTYGTLVFKGPAGMDLNTNTPTFQFNNSSYLTDLSKPVLYEFNFGSGIYQTMFCAIKSNPTISISVPSSGNGSGGGGSTPGGGNEGSIELEIHRYKHSENWATTYNVDLIKYDSETGKPLSGSYWDVLEYDTLGSYSNSSSQLGQTYLDHPASVAGSIGTDYNWANDNGTQFTRWSGEDPCIQDKQVTGTDGYLYETNTVGKITTTKAHSDSYNYTYTKGYCTGHPKPVITYYECEVESEDPEAQAEAEEAVAALNAELDAKAEAAWNEQVAYCQQLAAEGGFFHTDSQSISDAAKNQLTTDRNTFYNDFISLTYDYSAREIQARNGYILHGTHKDDIPIERVTVHASEYLNSSGTRSLMGAALQSEEVTEMGGDETEERLDVTGSGTDSGRELRGTETEAVMDTENGSVEKTEAVMDIDIDSEEETEEFWAAEEGEDIMIATDADAGTETDSGYDIVDEIVNAVKTAVNLLKGKLSSSDSSDTGMGIARSSLRAGSARTSSPPKTDGITYTGATNFESSTVSAHNQGTRTIRCWTFIAYDHRTEGEIHFNKTDLNLSAQESDEFDPYGTGQGDGTLEGAVYGLFALTEITHPDSEAKSSGMQNTGVVYQADDLVAVAATDRDGNGSFMAFTEAPGMTFNYDTGAIEKRTDINWTGPSNLHTAKAKADTISDNEKFYGWNASGSQTVSLTDSVAGNGTYYNKRSSNQGLNRGAGQDSGSTYPILNNEDNNGNAWIGRPLIVSGTYSTTYYIKELSRSEGYELSVYGENMQYTNREAFLNGGSITVEGDVSIGTMGTYQRTENNTNTIISHNDVAVMAVDITNGFDLTLSSLTQGMDIADFYLVTQTWVEKEKEITELAAKVYPAMAVAGQPVLIGGSRVEANHYDTISLPNGDTAVVRNTLTDTGERFYTAVASIAYGLPNATRFNDAAGDDFITKYNNALAGKGFKEPEGNGPWVLVPKGADDQESFNNLTAMLAEYTGFHAMRIVAEEGSNYVVQYSYGSGNPEAVYDMSSQLVWIKKDVQISGADGFIYAKYDAVTLQYTNNEFIINDQIPSRTNIVAYEDLSTITYTDSIGKTYWAYADGEQARDEDGNLKTYEEMEETTVTKLVQEYVDTETPVTSVTYNAAANSYTIHFETSGTYSIRIYYSTEEVNGTNNASYAGRYAILSHYIAPQTAGTYIKDVPLSYQGENKIISDYNTILSPIRVTERPIRQRIKVIKDILTNPDGSYANDTYSAVHEENVSESTGWFANVTDWLTKLLSGEEPGKSTQKLDNFRFKAYLKSNLERLYRDQYGNVVWLDRNGNTLIPHYIDMNNDGNYDTFTWIKTDGSIMDFPEKQIINGSVLESSNVQKIYTKVTHNTGSATTGDIANTVWAKYADPQTGETSNAGQLAGYTTSQDGAEGEAVTTNAALYSYAGFNLNTKTTDRINDGQNSGYIRILETTITDGVPAYDYEKFFDAVYTANTDKWDNDMFASEKNYPGQHWFETFYEKYQMDDADPDYTLANTDGADSDNTAGGDRNTSFKPFSWIRENIFKTNGEEQDYYQGAANNENIENAINTSGIANENAEASDAVRQFAIDYYLQDEVAKLVQNNGQDEDEAIKMPAYADEVYDTALHNALIKAVNYLKPFYEYDLDTIYCVEWDTEADGGADRDYTTLSVSETAEDKGYYYAVSSYLPYGTYLIVEQKPGRMDGTINDFANKNYRIDALKEIAVPTVYEGNQSDDTFSNYDEAYFYDTAKIPENLAKEYHIRFNEEWAGNHTDDLRNYVIRAHNNSGDYEVYKYGLDASKLTGQITYSGGSYRYSGFAITQEIYDPLKDYYNPVHKANGKNLTTADGANSSSHYFADDGNASKITANGSTYAKDAIEERYHYGSISEHAGTLDNVKSMTGNQTAYEGSYASILVPWTVVTPADVDDYDSATFHGLADIGFKNVFYAVKLRIEKLDSETGENIIHDYTIFGLYAASRYTTQEEVDKAIVAGAPADTKIGNVKIYLEDTTIDGSYEFLTAMKAVDIVSQKSLFKSEPNLYTGIVPAGTPVCTESEQIILHNNIGAKTGSMAVSATVNDVNMVEEDGAGKAYQDQNTGYFLSSQPIGAGVYVLVELKPPAGYARTNPIAIEIYSDAVHYYMDGNKDARVKAVVFKETDN